MKRFREMDGQKMTIEELINHKSEIPPFVVCVSYKTGRHRDYKNFDEFVEDSKWLRKKEGEFFVYYRDEGEGVTIPYLYFEIEEGWGISEFMDVHRKILKSLEVDSVNNMYYVLTTDGERAESNSLDSLNEFLEGKR